MKSVLITGMSGTGKSAVIQELISRGYRAYDLDSPDWSEWIDADPSDGLTPVSGKDWVWREDRVRVLLAEPSDKPLFVSGCAENMGNLLPLIDLVVLLSAPASTIMERLAARPVDAYGHTPAQREKVAALMSTVEPLLREAADREIDTRSSVSGTVDEILQLANQARC